MVVSATVGGLLIGAAFVIGVRVDLVASWRSYFDRVPVLRVLGRIA